MVEEQRRLGIADIIGDGARQFAVGDGGGFVQRDRFTEGHRSLLSVENQLSLCLFRRVRTIHQRARSLQNGQKTTAFRQLRKQDLRRRVSMVRKWKSMHPEVRVQTAMSGVFRR
jgi:hypothetical protein